MKGVVINTKDKKRQANNVELPDNVRALQLKIETFQQAKDRETCEWHKLCIGSPGYERWRAQQLFRKGKFDLTFSLLAAKAYSVLFDLRATELPCCTLSNVVKISGLAKQLSESLPISTLLPSDAQKPGFRMGLDCLHHWRPSDLQAGTSGRGDPIRRWMISKIAEEFCYATATQPTVAVVGDLIRLGWPKMLDRSIRNTLTEDLLCEAMETANTRRRHENQATTITHQAIAKASSKKFQIGTTNPERVAETSSNGAEIIGEMERLAANLPDEYIRKRALSFMQALRDEAGYPQEEPSEGN